MVCRNEWTFKIKDFPLRFFRYDFQHPLLYPLRTPSSNMGYESSFSNKHRKAYEYVKHNNLSKAFSTIVNTQPSVVPSEASFEKMQSKFPADSLMFADDLNFQADLLNFEQEEEILVDAG